ncbi:hypothetical protein WIW50_19835 [Flavobacteriaceae bacterium 3-367]
MNFQKLHLSRGQKNALLIFVNLLALGVKAIKHYVYDGTLSDAEHIWCYAVVPIVLINLIPLGKEEFARLKHILLFLSTGTIIGITLGEAVRAWEYLIWLEYLWLVLALIAAVLHYSPSKRDIYQSN